ncbi:DUF4157 domain-containing protein [Lentzea sp. BCCO 10_0061]|uniref:DUF4157 domain-containing protein n=1 Tax=Lentzea sokolovensis TaxID=3095429 RepID=A0ABU4V8U5_9PSEU|nr:DUF4157 domain-containing protein [Lentzea sp. BCCO 10_0061]MDX8147391.1 DUF4157 domain-containing protein [Lentzea sp. BCCO 10_0061]
MPDPQRTLGEQLAEQVRLLTRRRTASPGWTAAARTVSGRAAELARSARTGRERVEVAVSDPAEQPMTAVDAEWPARQEDPGSGHELSADVTGRLRAVVGSDLPPLRVRADATADAVARAHGADAVTIGHEVFFRDGRLAPSEPEGFALLAHEAWHVRQNSTAASWDRATPGGRADEEQRAHAVEWSALDGGRSGGASGFPDRHPVAGRVPPPVSHPGSPAPAAPTTATAMTAATDRTAAPPVTAPAALPDAAELSETIYRDLLRRIKSDVERGG